MLKKRSFNIAGHRTSVALEPEFWAVIETQASRAGISLSAFVAKVDAARGDNALASALRVETLRLAQTMQAI